MSTVSVSSFFSMSTVGVSNTSWHVDGTFSMLTGGVPGSISSGVYRVQVYIPGFKVPKELGWQSWSSEIPNSGIVRAF